MAWSLWVSRLKVKEAATLSGARLEEVGTPVNSDDAATKSSSDAAVETHRTTAIHTQPQPPDTHQHDAADITAGTLDGDRLPAISQTKKGGVPATGAPSGKYLKDDNTWDVPAGGGGGGTPADTVVTEQSFGQSSMAGIATAYSRGDHTHGTMPDPVPSHAALSTGVHGVGASTVESTSGSQGKVDTHSALATGIHGVGVSTIESAAGAQAKVDTHAGQPAPHTGHEAIAMKGANNGYCGLDIARLVDGDNLPAMSSTKKGGVPATGTPSGKYLKDNGTWDIPAGGSGDFYGFTRFLRAGRYHIFPAGTNTTRALTANQLYATPFFTPVARTVTKIAIHVTTLGSGANARLGIYADDGTVYPGSLVADCGVVSMASTGLKEITGLNITLNANTLYWLCLVPSVAATISAVTAGAHWSLLGYGTALNVVGAAYWRVAFTYAALPATFPAGAAAQTAAVPKVAIWF